MLTEHIHTVLKTYIFIRHKQMDDDVKQHVVNYCVPPSTDLKGSRDLKHAPFRGVNFACWLVHGNVYVNAKFEECIFICSKDIQECPNSERDQLTQTTPLLGVNFYAWASTCQNPSAFQI